MWDAVWSDPLLGQWSGPSTRFPGRLRRIWWLELGASCFSLSNCPARHQATPEAQATPMPQVARLPRKHQVIQLRRSGCTNVTVKPPHSRNYTTPCCKLRTFNDERGATGSPTQVRPLQYQEGYARAGPDTLGDAVEYERFREYLIKGRENQPRAGVALEMESQGYKVFILPPAKKRNGLATRGHDGGGHPFQLVNEDDPATSHTENFEVLVEGSEMGWFEPAGPNRRNEDDIYQHSTRQLLTSKYKRRFSMPGKTEYGTKPAERII
ncbi:hypothetical protein GQ600_597 [Phytophthora cactorum]|nr:hypothetical protein GQ600_597 [Phytophthora cactorum]